MYSLADVLAEANRFRVEDLAVNHQGWMTRAQKFRLLRRIILPIALFIICALVLIGLLVALSIADRTGYYLKAVLNESGARFLLLLILASVLAVAFLWRSLKLIADLFKGRVAVTEGRVKKDFEFNYRSTSLYYEINGLKFEVSGQAYNALIDGSEYRLFYTPRSKFLVSIEPTEAGAPDNAAFQTHDANQTVTHNVNPYMWRGLAIYLGALLLCGVVVFIIYLADSNSAVASHQASSETTNAPLTGNDNARANDNQLNWQREISSGQVRNLGALDAKAISKPAPVYPGVAKGKHVSGSVIIQVIVDESGDVISGWAISGHPLLQQAAIEAAYQAKFSPSRQRERTVKIAGTLTYKFMSP